MSDEIPPASDANDTSVGLGSVPPKPEPAITTPTVPVGGGFRPNTGRPENLPTQPISGATRQNEDPPTLLTSPSAKRWIIGLSVATAGLAALSGYGLIQGNKQKQSLDNANAAATAVGKTNEALNSDLKKARKDMADTQEAHKDTISKKDKELREAKAKATGASDELAKQEERVKELESQTEAANSAVEEKERLQSELTELKSAKEDLAGQKARAAQEILRLTGELTRPKTVTPVSVPNQDAPSPTKPSVRREDKPEVSEESPRGLPLAWKILGKYETGKNKGRWYFVAPNGFVSPLYGSREMAVYQAELRAGFSQPKIFSQMSN
jgi:hypothetical protein